MASAALGRGARGRRAGGRVYWLVDSVVEPDVELVVSSVVDELGSTVVSVVVSVEVELSVVDEVGSTVVDPPEDVDVVSRVDDGSTVGSDVDDAEVVDVVGLAVVVVRRAVGAGFDTDLDVVG